MVNKGDIINLTDIQTLEDMMEEGKAVATGLDLVVSDVRVINNSEITWEFYSFDEQDLVVVRKTIPGIINSQWYVYFPAEGFTPGSREEIVNNNCQWIFTEPENPNYSYDDLKFSDRISSSDGDFVKFLEVYGHDKDAVYALVEWENDNLNGGCTNPNLLSLEVGNYIKVLQGVPVEDTDIKVYNRS